MTLDSGSGAGGDGEPPFGGAYGRLKLLLLLAVAVLLVVGVFALVGKVAGYTRTLNRLKDAEPLWLSVCFVSQVLMYFGYVSVVRAIVRHDGGPTLRPWLATKVVLASLGATRLLGAGGAGGLAILYWLLRQIGNTRREAAVRVLAFNTLLFAWFGAAAAAAALLALLSARGDVPPAMTVPWLAGVAACAAAAAWLSAPGRSRRLAAAAGGGRARQGLAAAVAGVVVARRLCREDATRRAALVGAPAYWLADMACLWAGLRAFDVRIAIPELVLAYATGYLANMLPLPTGGIGGVDAATTFALTALGVPLAPALLGVFAYRFFSFLLPTVPAVLTLPALPRAGRELREGQADGGRAT